MCVVPFYLEFLESQLRLVIQSDREVLVNLAFHLVPLNLSLQ